MRAGSAGPWQYRRPVSPGMGTGIAADSRRSSVLPGLSQPSGLLLLPEVMAPPRSVSAVIGGIDRAEKEPRGK